jgi:hypothetical protein
VTATLPDEVRGNWAAYTGCFEIAFVLVRLDHIASRIVNADHGITAFDLRRRTE